MKIRINEKEMLAWRDAVGPATAIRLIQEELECSQSKADKLSRGKYDRGISAAEQKLIASLTGRSRDVLFPGACKRMDRAS